MGENAPWSGRDLERGRIDGLAEGVFKKHPAAKWPLSQ